MFLVECTKIQLKWSVWLYTGKSQSVIVFTVWTRDALGAKSTPFRVKLGLKNEINQKTKNHWRLMHKDHKHVSNTILNRLKKCIYTVIIMDSTVIY